MECMSLVAPQNKGNLPGMDRIATLMGFGDNLGIRAAMGLTLICFVDTGVTSCYT